MRTLLVALLLAAPLTMGHASAPSHPAPAATGARPVDPSAAWRTWLTEQRHTQIARLRAYAEAGVFPQNDEMPGMLSMLVDDEGHPCAMASLVIQSGHPGLISRLSTQDNALQFGDQTEGALYEWILTSGLTIEETAFVQEPDFFVSDTLDPEQRALMVQAETERLRIHFLSAALQLEAYEATSLDTAMARLGDRVHTAPPR